MLRFQPTAQVHSLFPKDIGDKDPMIYVDQLVSIAANTTLYDVYAWDARKEDGGSEKLIGQLVLDGQMVRSKWGDDNLFFRHQKMDDDIKLQPSWSDYVPRWSLDGKCPF